MGHWKDDALAARKAEVDQQTAEATKRDLTNRDQTVAQFKTALQQLLAIEIDAANIDLEPRDAIYGGGYIPYITLDGVRFSQAFRGDPRDGMAGLAVMRLCPKCDQFIRGVKISTLAQLGAELAEDYEIRYHECKTKAQIQQEEEKLNQALAPVGPTTPEDRLIQALRELIETHSYQPPVY